MSTRAYGARWVLPIDGDAIEEGEVIVENGVIQAVRPRRLPASECWDFGNAVLLPGLVNAHTHLEYTALRGFLEDVPFFPWIRALTAAKARFTQEDWLWSARLGAMETVAGGVTTIGDNADAGVTMQVASETGLRGVVFQELFGIDDRQPVQPALEALRAKIVSLRLLASDRLRVGVSPHALYTIRPALFDVLNPYVISERLPTSIHVAESPAESALMEQGVGPFAEMFAARGITWGVPGTTPTQYAAGQGALRHDTLAVHCVHQTPDDIAVLANSGAAVVHCPKSNSKLGAGIAPLTEWLRTPGLRVALGTDSAVSNNTLDLWEEMRFALLLQRARTETVEAVTAHQVLRMATLGGAEALGLAALTGSFTPGKRADMIAVRLDAAHTTPATDPCAALVYSARAADVVFTLCDGDVLFDNGQWTTLDATAVLAHASAVRQKAGGDSSPRMTTKPRTAKAASETDKTGGYKGSAQTGIVTFFVGTLIAVYLFLTNPDPKSFEEYNFINTGLCLWLPLITVLFVFRQEPNQFGLTRGDQKLGFKWVRIAWIGMILPLVWYSLQTSAKQFYVQGRLESYYLSGLGTVLNPVLHTINYKALLYFELGTGFYMFCWEFFFRGFLLFGLQKSRLGTWGAVIIQALLFMLLHSAWKDQNHAAKPILETLSALPGGIILGVLAIKTRSFIYGFLAHWAISVTLDLFLLVPFIFHHIG